MAVSKRAKIILLAVGVVLLLALVYLAVRFGLPFMQRMQDPEFQARIQAWAANAGWKAALFLLLGIVIQIVFAFIPNGPVDMLTGAIFGVGQGFLLCLVGYTLASALVFSLVRKFGYPLVQRLFSEKNIREFSFLNDSKKLETVIFLLFLIPYMPKDLLTYLAGLTPIRMSRFLILSMLGRIPSMLASILIGASAGTGNWSAVIVLFGVTIGLAVLGVIYKDKIIARLRRHSPGGAHGSQAERGAGPESGPGQGEE